MKNILIRLGKITRAVEDYTLISILAGMMLLAVSQIIMRNFLEMGLSWIDPLIRISVLWVALIGAMIGTRQGGHISVDLLAQYVSPAYKEILQRVIAAISASISGMMCWVSFWFVLDEYEYGIAAFGNVPSWPFEIIMPIGFAVICFRFITFIFTGNQEQNL